MQDGPGSNTVKGEIFRTRSDRIWGVHPAFHTTGIGSFFRGQGGRVVALTTHSF